MKPKVSIIKSIYIESILTLNKFETKINFIFYKQIKFNKYIIGTFKCELI